jgi:hypothetical protein
MLRLAAALAMLVGVIGLLGYLHLVGKGPFASPAARHLRSMKDRTEEADAVTPITFAEFAALPRGRPSAETAALERRGVTLTGWVQCMLRASDGDLHLEIAPRGAGPATPDTAYVTAEITPAWQRGSERWRFEPLLAALRPNAGGPAPWPQGPRRVRVAGWLLYDFPQEDTLPAPRRGSSGTGDLRLSAWEIHPVSRIELWDEARGSFVELAR